MKRAASEGPGPSGQGEDRHDRPARDVGDDGGRAGAEGGEEELRPAAKRTRVQRAAARSVGDKLKAAGLVGKPSRR